MEHIFTYLLDILQKDTGTKNKLKIKLVQTKNKLKPPKPTKINKNFYLFILKTWDFVIHVI